MEQRPDTLDAEADLQAEVAELETLFGEIDLALRRLEDGTYGTCQHCGEPIADARLADDPTAVTCERHPRLAEQDREEQDGEEADSEEADSTDPALPGAPDS